ncbi:MAG: hypothetical protein JEY91_01435 [Spirochaetaceae bacterium]|nr:hypothetical protein [Spirochaetaceae bacterium]
MLELPEAYSISQQIKKNLTGKRITHIITLQSPHKLTWFNGDPGAYNKMLMGKTIENATYCGGMVKIELGKTTLLLSDGINLRYFENSCNLPPKHQLLLEFSDSTYLCSSTQMYGGIVCFQNGIYENDYYKAALEKPSPLSSDFTKNYFLSLLKSINPEKTSAKAFLATEQRIPGLGNGVLQDILFNASIHPKRKMNSLGEKEIENLYNSIIATLREMCDRGGRNTEKDLFGNSCAYQTLFCKKNLGQPCPSCGSVIEKANYMGGTIYYCGKCQKY